MTVQKELPETKQSKILTFYITKDSSTFNEKNYKSVKLQRRVIQDIFVVSAEPIPVDNNIVVTPPRNMPVPIRVGYSINKALFYLRRKGLRLSDYNFLFKIDGDVILSPSFLSSLARKGTLVAGKGAAMVISSLFYRVVLNGLYPINHCDDGFIMARAVSLGVWPVEYRNEKPLLFIPVQLHFKDREFAYGVEYYKWGMSFQLLLLWMTMKIIGRMMYIGRRYNPYTKKVSDWVSNLAGYTYAVIKKASKYMWSDDYKKYMGYYLVRKIIGKLIV